MKGSAALLVRRRNSALASRSQCPNWDFAHLVIGFGPVQEPSLRQTLSFVRSAYARAGADGHRRWPQAMGVVNLLPTVLPGIKVTLEERQVALLRDVFRTTLETEESLLEAGFSEE